MKKTNVTIFGDSIAKGLVLKKGRPVSLGVNAVDLVAKHFGMNINNKSAFGQTIVRLREKGLVDEYLKKLDKKQRNIVVFCIGGNDSDFWWQEVAKTPLAMHDCKTPLDTFAETYMSLITKLKKKKVQVFVCALPTICSQIFLEHYIASLADKNKVLQFFDGDISNISRHQEVYNNKLREIAAQTKCDFLDIRTPFLQAKNLVKLYDEDGIHPNEVGQRLIANTVINFFEKKTA